MSAEARNDPEGYLRREGEHKPYEPVKASTPKPEATAGDRELARQIFEVSETTDPFSEAHLVKLIASHVAGRLAPVEAERDALRATVAKMREALAQVAGLYPSLAQLLQGWHADGTAWSEWDEQVFQTMLWHQRLVEATLAPKEGK